MVRCVGTNVCYVYIVRYTSVAQERCVIRAVQELTEQGSLCIAQVEARDVR